MTLQKQREALRKDVNSLQGYTANEFSSWLRDGLMKSPSARREAFGSSFTPYFSTSETAVATLQRIFLILDDKAKQRFIDGVGLVINRRDPGTPTHVLSSCITLLTGLHFRGYDCRVCDDPAFAPAVQKHPALTA